MSTRNPDTLFRGGETSILFRGLRASRLPPLWDCFWAFLNKGLVKKSIIWAILNFLNSIPFQKRFWSFLHPAQRGFRGFQGSRQNLNLPDPDTLFRGVRYSFLFRGLRASRLPPLWDWYRAFLNKGLVKKSIIWAILNSLNSISFQKRFDGSSQLALLQEKRRFRQAKRKEVDSGTKGDWSSKGFQGVSGFQKKS